MAAALVGRRKKNGGGGVTAMVVVAAVVAAAAAAVASGDFAADRAECADKLMGLATCLTFVQEKATARAPTPDCCVGLKQVVSASKKCLCVLVRDRDDPQLGFRINVTRAMDLPDLCNFPATFSDCPKILDIPDSSPDAEIFKQYARDHENRANIPPAAAAAAGAAAGKNASTAATGGAGAGMQLGTLFFYLVSALLASVAVVA